MSYLRLWYSNWYVFHDGELSPEDCSDIDNQTLSIWYPYHENALHVKYKDIQNVTPEFVQKHFEIPIPEKDMKELFFAIEEFKYTVLRDAGKKTMKQRIAKFLSKKRVSNRIAKSRWIRRSYDRSMESEKHNENNVYCLYHDDGFQNEWYSKNMCFIRSFVDDAPITDCCRIANLHYNDIAKMKREDLKIHFSPAYFQWGEHQYDILWKYLGKFKKDVEKRYPNPEDR
jgi:hypothetical protein